MNAETIAALWQAALGAGIGAAAGILRSIIYGVGGIGAAISSIAAAVVMGGTTALVVSGARINAQPLSTALQMASIILASFIGRDLLDGLRTFGSGFAADPIAIFRRLIDAIRGR